MDNALLPNAAAHLLKILHALSVGKAENATILAVDMTTRVVWVQKYEKKLKDNSSSAI